MPDNKQETRPQDASRVNIHEDYEVRYWCKKFGCSKEELVKAVGMVGAAAAKVEEHLAGKK